MKKLTLARANEKLLLGQELGRGGEGTVFEISGSRAAKIYSSPPKPRKVEKLAAMARAAEPSLLAIAAWPIDLLQDGKGATRGFVMPRVVARRDIHELYSPKSRAEAFPEASFRFLVHVAANIARAFAVVHQHGHVLGDVNHGNLLVGRDATVMLIDCDSFQIGQGSETFTCDVGVPLFTAPELHGRSFRGLVRTPTHDLFGLAILLFHLLYMGRHPFAGRYSGPGDMPIEKAIAEHRFAYGPDRKALGMEKPPGTLPLETMGSALAANFAKAFGRNPSERPSAKAWIEALGDLEANLATCKATAAHHYPRALPTCPWCGLEKQMLIRLFGQRLSAGPTGTVEVGTLWRAIVAVPDPGPAPSLPSDYSARLPPSLDLPQPLLKRVRKVSSLLILFAGQLGCLAVSEFDLRLALLGIGLAAAIWPHVKPAERAAAEGAYTVAEGAWEKLRLRWEQQASQQVFSDQMTTLREARNSLEDLANERKRRLKVLHVQRQSLQLERYLDRFRIDLAKIPGIGSGRTAMLASYGVETAADVDRHKIRKIPGFGPSLTSELVNWRISHQRHFRFNAMEPVDPRAIAALDAELEALKRNLLATLQRGPRALTKTRQSILAARKRLMPEIEDAWTELEVAKARRRAL